jgi:hypothetical protein
MAQAALGQPARKPGRPGIPNKLDPALAEALAHPPDGTEWGPTMEALSSDRHRAFVIALYQVKQGHGAQVRAAKLAGWGTSTSSAKSWSVIASTLAHDEKIQAALYEEDQKRIRASSPRAIRALSNMIENPNHKDHARAVGMVLERVHPAETTHHVKVEHKRQLEVVATEEVLERIRQLAKLAGLDAKKMPRMIDVEYRDVTDGEGAQS